MSITYLDENLLLSKDKYYVTDKDFLFNIKYYIRKKSAFERYNAYIEERMHDVYNSELNDMLDYYINIFKENYSRILYKSVNNISIEENRHATDYLENTFPYCFFKDGMVDTKDLDSALIYFAKNNLRAKDDKLKDIIPVLKTMSVRLLDDFNIDNYAFSYGLYRYSDICGTVNPKYQRDNLYETLHALDDYDLKKYINYVMVMDGLTSPRNIKVFDPILFVDNQAFQKMLYVVEGNHRLFACKALYEITRLVTLNSFNNDSLFYNKSLKRK